MKDAKRKQATRRAKLRASSLFARIPKTLPEELFEEILRTPAFHLERIVSRGHVSPEGHWYDQDRDEWVLVLRGRARLEIEGDESLVELGPGEHALLPARRRHRVAWTDPKTETVWLALHF